MTEILSIIHSFLWGAPVLVLILGVGLWLSLASGFSQLTLFPGAVRAFFRKFTHRDAHGGVSGFQALCTALAATVGTGNLVGVAGAVCIGGPGAVFWMWICGILGMIVKCAEVTLAVRYRVTSGNTYLGGPMYIIRGALGSRWQWLACVYAFLGMAAAFGVGNAAQINAVISGINAVFPVAGDSLRRDLALGLMLAVLVGSVLLGGARRVGDVAQVLIPVVSLAYVILCVTALIACRHRVPGAFRSIFMGAFDPSSVTGGVIGSAFLALRTGCSRGVFTNESGMGTASIAHASADTAHPVEQGLLGIMEVFLDTILICTLTALVILSSGIALPYGSDPGAAVTDAAFCSVYGGWASVFLAGALSCFAFATVLGWGLYGARCAGFLFGRDVWQGYALAQTLAVIPAAVMKPNAVWLLAEILNGLMSIPNLIVLAVLAPQFLRLLNEFKRKSGISDAGGGKICKFPSTPTAVSPLPCGNSIPTQSRLPRQEKRSIT